MAARSKKRSTAVGLVPAVAHSVAEAARADPRLHQLSPPESVLQAINAFETLLGGRRTLIEALSTAEDDPEVFAVLRILGDPANETPSIGLAEVCRRADITPFQLFSAVDRASQLRGQMLSRVKASIAAPQITEELIEQAQKHDRACSTCNGVGETTAEPTREQPNPRPVLCVVCNGVGTLPVGADFDSQKQVLEIAGVIKKGPLVQQNTLVNNPPVGFGNSLEQLQQAMGSVMYGARRPAAPIVDVPPTPLPTEPST